MGQRGFGNRVTRTSRRFIFANPAMDGYCGHHDYSVAYNVRRGRRESVNVTTWLHDLIYRVDHIFTQKETESKLLLDLKLIYES